MWPPEIAFPQPRPGPATGAGPARCVPAAPAAAADAGPAQPVSAAQQPPCQPASRETLVARSLSLAASFTAPSPCLRLQPVQPLSPLLRTGYSGQPGHPHRQLRVDDFELAPCQLHIARGQRHIFSVSPLRLDHLPRLKASRLRTRNSRTGTATSSSTGSRATGARERDRRLRPVCLRSTEPAPVGAISSPPCGRFPAARRAAGGAGMDAQSPFGWNSAER